jgi:hypothetical protein
MLHHVVDTLHSLAVILVIFQNWNDSVSICPVCRSLLDSEKITLIYVKRKHQNVV